MNETMVLTADFRWCPIVINANRQTGAIVYWAPPLLKRVLERCYLADIQWIATAHPSTILARLKNVLSCLLVTDLADHTL